VLLAQLLFDGATTSTLIQGSSSRVVFQMSVTTEQLALSAALACGIAVLSCIIPALRAQRIPVRILLAAR
jgi:ABC-type antimicrobial peptide transport system permease subunit